MKNQGKEVDHHYIHQAVCSGTFSTDPEFNKQKENLEALITYVQVLEPSQQALNNILKLIKFYRFPMVLLFRQLYQKISELDSDEIKSIEDQLRQISSRVSAFIQLAGIKVFEEIKFIFQYQKSKKKFKFSISKEEIQFAEFIYLFSQEKKKLIEGLKRGQENAEELLTKLDQLKMKRQGTPIEDYVIQQLKESSLKQFERLRQQSSSSELQEEKKIEQEEKPDLSEKKVKMKPKFIKKEKDPKQLELQQQELFKKAQQQKHEHNNKLKNLNEKGEEVNYQQQRQLPMCCRRFFKSNEVLDQPQNLKIEYKYYRYPFKDRPDQKPGKIEKIKKTICGFLNTEGGIIFFGIKQNPDTKKREAGGYVMSQKTKIDFRNVIFGFLKEIYPDASSKCTIKWVPIKSTKIDQFLHGVYVPKVIIQKGAKQNLYSYYHDKQQRFAFKTQNQFLVITDAQKILKMFHDKLKYPQRVVYSLHQHPCKEPFLGKPLYDDHKIQKFSFHDFGDEENDFPSIYEKRDEREEKKQSSTKKFKEKGSSEYLILGMTKEKLREHFQKDLNKLGSITEVEPEALIVIIHDPQFAKVLGVIGGQVIQVYNRVKFNTDDKELLKDIVKQIEKSQSMAIQQRREGLFCFKDSECAVRFWLKARNIDYGASFTPET